MSFLGPIIERINALNAHYNAISVSELQEMSIMQRFQLYDWTFEAYACAAIMALVLMYTIGSRVNSSKASAILDGVSLKSQFYQVGVSETQKYVQEGSQWFTGYATGRINVASLTTKIYLFPRHNIFGYVAELISATFFNQEEPEYCVFEFKTSLPKFLYGIVNKNCMSDARKNSYALSLTSTLETDKSQQYVIMTESKTLSSTLPLEKLWKVLNKCKFVQYISIADIPESKPTALYDATSVVQLRIDVVSGKKDIANLNELISVLLEFIDTAAGLEFKPELAKKIAALRVAEEHKIMKHIEESKLQRAQDKKLEQERKMAGKSLDEYEEKMKEKRERRAKNKQRMRM